MTFILIKWNSLKTLCVCNVLFHSFHPLPLYLHSLNHVQVNYTLKVNCRKKFEQFYQLLAKPAPFYNTHSILNYSSAILFFKFITASSSCQTITHMYIQPKYFKNNDSVLVPKNWNAIFQTNEKKTFFLKI